MEAKYPMGRVHTLYVSSVHRDPVLDPFVYSSVNLDEDDLPGVSDTAGLDEWAVDGQSLEVDPFTASDPWTCLTRSSPLARSAFMALHIATQSLKGRLRSRYAEWVAINACGIVKNWIRHGYQIPFVNGTPTESFHCGRNHPGATTHRDWLRETVRELVSLDAVGR